MKLFKNYKKLYEIEKENNKVLNKRNQDLYSFKIKAQQEIKDITKERSTLFVNLEDIQYELHQANVKIETLEKELTNVTRIKTRFQNKLKKIQKENNENVEDK